MKPFLVEMKYQRKSFQRHNGAPREGRTAGENHPLKPTLILRRLKKNFFPSFYLYLLFPLFFKIPMLSYAERLLGDLRQFLAENSIFFGQLAH